MAIVRGQDVLDSYQQVLPGAAQYDAQYLRGVEESIRKQDLPVRISRESASTGLLKAALGKSREFLVVQPDSRNLDVFRVMHYALVSGSNLAVGWYLVGKVPGLGQAQFRVPVIDSIDIFDNADLQALVVGIHQFAVMDSVIFIAESVGYRRERINARTRGLYGAL